MEESERITLIVVIGVVTLFLTLLSAVSVEGHMVRQAKLGCLSSPQAPTVLECKVLFE